MKDTQRSMNRIEELLKACNEETGFPLKSKRGGCDYGNVFAAQCGTEACPYMDVYRLVPSDLDSGKVPSCKAKVVTPVVNSAREYLAQQKLRNQGNRTSGFSGSGRTMNPGFIGKRFNIVRRV